MNEDQKVGALVFAVALTLIAVTLVLSEGWGHSNVSLFLHFQYGESYSDAITVYSRYVLAPLVIVAGYGAIRYFSLLPPIFRRQPKSKDEEA